MNNETLLQHFYDTAPLLSGVIMLTDNDFIYVKANKLTQDFFGKKEHEIVNHRASELGTSREYIDLWIKHSLEAERTNAPVYFDYERKTPNGIKYFSANAMFLGSGKDSQKYYSYITQDITDKRMAHIENARLLSDFNAILSATTEVSIISTNMDGIITFFNRGAEKMLGYKAEEVMGIHTPKLFYTKEEAEEREKALVEAKAKDESIKPIEIYAADKFEPKDFTYVRKDGGKIPVQLVVTRKIDTEGKQIGYVGMATNISKIKAVEEELAEANKELESFAYVVSHDLQEPLRVIKGFISLLNQKYISKLDETAKSYMTLIADGANRMQGMIKDILEYSRQSKISIELERVDLNTTINEIKDIFLIKEISPIIECNAMPTIIANQLGMERLFANLIGNAIKYQPAGNKPIIHISVEENNTYWEFSVADNGIGISEENYNKVFILFQRLYTKEKYSGTGIGLSICQKIVAQHKGKIWVEPSSLGGSSFKFTIAKLDL